MRHALPRERNRPDGEVTARKTARDRQSGQAAGGADPRAVGRSARVTLQTRELVVPNRAAAGFDLSDAEAPPGADALDAGSNRLIYGDNLLAMAALLAGDETTGTESFRGKVDLIYIDPPFDSKADYRTKLQLPGSDVEQRSTIAEQHAYSDTWAKGTESYLEMIVPRLVLMRELLADSGTIYVHLDWHVGHYVKLMIDEIFGKENFINEVIWRYRRWPTRTASYQRMHDVIFSYAKNRRTEGASGPGTSSSRSSRPARSRPGGPRSRSPTSLRATGSRARPRRNPPGL